MKLNLESLKNKESWSGYSLFSFDHDQVAKNTKERPEWVHFGAGNIFRIFPAALCQNLLNAGLMDTGIVVGEGFDFEIIDKIYQPHDNLTLAVTLKADGTISKEVIGSVTESAKVDPSDKRSWSILEDVFKNPSLKMVSFTITEKGYATQAADGTLLKGYVADFDKPISEASMFLCRLTRLLNLRYETNKAPLALVSMDNCSHNGEKLQAAMLTIAKAYAEKGQLSKGFVEYLSDEKQVAFPWSMIDKITPRPDASVKAMLEADGFEDTDILITDKRTYIAPFVNAEEAQYLVIEDSFPAGRPALEKAGVYLTTRETVNKVEKMKVCTCLNPLHTALALSGCLLGYTLIADEMKDEDLVNMVKRLGYAEGLPVVVNPGILDPKAFIDEVLEKRVPNPFMPDTPQRIATDTSQKLSIRFGETIKAYQASSELSLDTLKVVPLTFALFCRYMMGVDDEGNAFELSPDPMIATIKPVVEGIKLGDKGPFDEILKPLLSNEKIFGLDVTGTDLYKSVVEDFTAMVAAKGAVRATIHKIVTE